MKFSVMLFTVGCFLPAALGALPAPGAPYRIQNVATGLVFDNDFASTTPGNQIIAFKIGNGNTGQKAQRISIQRTGTLLGGVFQGLFTFSFPSSGVRVYVEEPEAAGVGLNAQNWSTEFTVTEVSPEVYTIAYPFSNFVVTCPAEATTQITLQPFNASEPLQQWKFILFQ